MSNMDKVLGQTYQNNLATKIAGEDITNDFLITSDKCTATTVDLTTDADIVVTASPALLLGAYFYIATEHDVLLKDSSGTKITFPAPVALGTKIELHGASVLNITMESENTEVGKMILFWRAG